MKKKPLDNREQRDQSEARETPVQTRCDFSRRIGSVCQIVASKTNVSTGAVKHFPPPYYISETPTTARGFSRRFSELLITNPMGNKPRREGQRRCTSIA